MLTFPSFHFFFVPALFFLANGYLYNWLTRWLKPSRRQSIGIGLALLLLVIAFPLSKILGRYNFNAFNHWLAFISSLWLGLSLYSGILALGSDLLSIFLRKVSWLRPFSPAQSSFRRGVWVASIGVMVLLIGVYAFWEARKIEVTRLDIPLRKLPRAMDGFTVVQISDVHYGMLNENGRLGDIVQRINELHPDLVAITGDLVDERVSHMEAMAIPLAQLKSRYGVFAVMGNHEFFAGVDRAARIMGQAGIHVLRNEGMSLPNGLQILGVDDPMVLRRTGKPLPDFDGLLSTLNPEQPSILLYHQPVQFEKAASRKVGLQLSGHTHGAQMFPLRFFVDVSFPYARGLFQIKESFLYVSRGVGTGGPPMRHGSPPEIVMIRLQASNAP